MVECLNGRCIEEHTGYIEEREKREGSTFRESAQEPAILECPRCEKLTSCL